MTGLSKRARNVLATLRSFPLFERIEIYVLTTALFLAVVVYLVTQSPGIILTGLTTFAALIHIIASHPKP